MSLFGKLGFVAFVSIIVQVIAFTQATPILYNIGSDTIPRYIIQSHEYLGIWKPINLISIILGAFTIPWILIYTFLIEDRSDIWFYKLENMFGDAEESRLKEKEDRRKNKLDLSEEDQNIILFFIGALLTIFTGLTIYVVYFL